MVEKLLLTIILVLFLILGTGYAILTPVFEASDELWHYPMVQHLADGNPLPVQAFDPVEAGLWKQEASQPPLYYWLGAALTFWIDTTDMVAVRRLNPHVDNGVITPDGNINLVVHDPAGNPLQGTLLAVRIVRLASVLMGAVTVLMTYRMAKYAAPDRPEISLGSAALIAFTPMFLFISGAVNNDNLAIMLAAIALVLLVAQLDRPRLSWAQELAYTFLIGVIIGLGLLTKEGTLALLPLAFGALFMRQWVLAGKSSGSDRSPFALTVSRSLRLLARSVVSFLLLCIPVLLIAGWWYYRNIALYGDWLGWNAFIAVLGQRAQPASLAQLWDERAGFLMSYWGLFGGVNVPMWNPTYRLLNGALLVALVGFLVYLLQQSRTWLLRPLTPLTEFAGRMLNLVVRYFPLVICLLFSAAVVYGLVSWATITWSSQGRLVFTALSALSVLFMVGLVGWMPARPARIVAAGFSLLLLIIAAAAPVLWIAPAYQADKYTPPQLFVLQPIRAEFGQMMRLTGYSIEPEDVGTTVTHPGENIDITLNWEVLRPMSQDLSVFVHLNDPILDTPLAQRDMYHGQGLRPTSLLNPGEEMITYYQLHVPETAIAPAKLDVIVGLYDFESGERLKLDSGEDALPIGSLLVESNGAESDKALSLNFGDAIEIVGYELVPRKAAPGETLTLRLYWQPGPALDQDYTFFAQVVDQDTTRWASADISPTNGTSNATLNEVQTLELSLTLDPETPATVYPLIVGLYSRDEGGNFNRLQVVQEGRITMADFVELTRVRVD